jgi:hypothetical protein
MQCDETVRRILNKLFDNDDLLKFFSTSENEKLELFLTELTLGKTIINVKS